MPPSPGRGQQPEDPGEPAPSSSTTLATDTLPLHADAAAFCPTARWRCLLAAGGYELDEASGKRAGIIRLYDTRAGRLRVAGPDWTGAGVLDAAWAPSGEGEEAAARPLLGLALADGSAALLAADGGGCEGGGGGDEDDPISLSPACAAVAVEEGGGLCLAAAWQGGAHHPARLAVSTSAGRLAVLTLAPAGLATEVAPWTAHALEAWTVAWGNGGGLGGVLLSGADDAALKGWDVRAGPAPAAPALAFGDARSHGAGVTAIAPHPALPGLLVTGSYDERARLWDARSPGRPVLVSTLHHAGGGVWRLRWHPSDPTLLLVAGMHAGFCILRTGKEEGGGGGGSDLPFSSVSVAERYPHQATLAYGCDWRSGAPSHASASLVATASFYDNLVHLWTPGTRAE